MNPSGEQWTIRHGEQEAVVTQVGGTLRAYTVAGEPLVAGFGADEQILHCRGQQLMPWPNRIADGVYHFDGEQQQLWLTEPDRANALHGLVAWVPWTLVEHSDAALAVAVRLFPQPGYPWALDLETTYALGDDGLVVTTTARNLSDSVAPFGYGSHPYLTVGEQRVDEVRVTVPADRYLDVDGDRLLPVADTVAASLRPVDGTDADLRAGEALGRRALDVAMTGLPERWAVRLEAQRGVELWADAATFPWLQVFTGDALPDAYRRTSGIAVEPLTSPPNAFATGEGVVRLEPGATWSGTWGLRPR